MPKVVLLCGLPGAGKSTVAKFIEARIPHTNRIEYDQLSCADASLELWRAARMQAVQELERSISNFDLILLDDNFYLRSMRKDIVRALYEHRTEVTFGIIYLATNVTKCLQRNRTRARSIPEDTIRSMADRFEPPKEPSPYYWDVNVLELDTTTGSSSADNNHHDADMAPQHWDTIQDFLQHKLGPIPYPQPTEQPITDATTLAQRRDAHWRLLVRAIGQRYPRLAKHANQARRYCLQSECSTLHDFLTYGDWIPKEEFDTIRTELEVLGDPPAVEENNQ